MADAGEVIYHRDDEHAEVKQPLTTPEGQGTTAERDQGGQKGGCMDKTKNLFVECGNGMRNNKVFSACVIADFVLIIIILGVTIAWLRFAQTEIVDFDPADQLFDIDCKYIENKQKFFPEATNDGRCTGKNGLYIEHVLSKYVNKTLNEQFREKPLFQLCMNASTAEHPKGYAQIRKISSTDATVLPQLNLIKWGTSSSSKPDTFFNNISYDAADGTFQVVRPGYYHVYSNIAFEFNTVNVSFPAVLRHLILKYRKDYNVGEKLLEGYSTQCQVMTETTTFSSFVFGNFYFENTDKIKVFLNDPTYLSAEKSYFGMFLI